MAIRGNQWRRLRSLRLLCSQDFALSLPERHAFCGLLDQPLWGNAFCGLLDRPLWGNGAMVSTCMLALLVAFCGLLDRPLWGNEW